MEFVTHSPEQTRQLGARLAKALKPGAVVAFTGDLGAGKTAFVSGMAQGLGVRERVTSPTFTIVNEYEGDGCPCSTLICTDWAAPTSCSTSAGRITWIGAACAPWSGARMWPKLWRLGPSGCPSAERGDENSRVIGIEGVEL